MSPFYPFTLIKDILLFEQSSLLPILVSQSARSRGVRTAHMERNTKRMTTDARPASAKLLVSVGLPVNSTLSVSLFVTRKANVSLFANFAVNVNLPANLTANVSQPVNLTAKSQSTCKPYSKCQSA